MTMMKIRFDNDMKDLEFIKIVSLRSNKEQIEKLLLGVSLKNDKPRHLTDRNKQSEGHISTFKSNNRTIWI